MRMPLRASLVGASDPGPRLSAPQEPPPASASDGSQPVAATVSSTPPSPATTSVSTQAPYAPPPATSYPSPAAQIAATLVAISNAPNGAQRSIMTPQSSGPEQVQIHSDPTTNAAPAHAAVASECPETPCVVAATLTPAGAHAAVLKTPSQVPADAVTEPGNAQSLPDQTVSVKMLSPQSVTAAPDPESSKTYPASDVTTARSRQTAAVRRATDTASANVMVGANVLGQVIPRLRRYHRPSPRPQQPACPRVRRIRRRGQAATRWSPPRQNCHLRWPLMQRRQPH